MLVWQAINARVSSKEFERDLDIRLPWALKTDPISTRGILFHRIRMSRARPAGSRAAVLDGQPGPSITRSGRQRVVVRGLVSFHAGSGWLRVKALKAHIRYLGRGSARYHGDRPMFFDGQSDEVDALSRANEWRNDRRHFRFVISPEHGDRIADMRDYVRILFARVCSETGAVLTPQGKTPVLHHDQRGRPLPRWSGCRELSPDEVFLLGTSSSSFDSRYFGPVRMSDIEAVYQEGVRW